MKNLCFVLPTVASVVLGLMSFVTQAGATTFRADGLFSDGAALSGTLSIDTNVGTVTAADLMIKGVGTFSTISLQFNFGSPVFYSVVVDDAAMTEEFSFGLLTDTLVGYAGGDLCSESTVGCFSSTYYPFSNPGDQVALSSGSLTSGIGVSDAAPEPTTLSFLGVAFALGLTIHRWGRRHNSSLA